MRKLLIILSVLLCAISSFSQTYNPTLHTTINKAMGEAQAAPLDARTMFFDAVNFVYRPYQSIAEIKSYLNLSKYRVGNPIMIVDSGGTLNGNGTYTGGVNNFWMFRNGTADGDLVELNLFGSTGGGSSGITQLTATNINGINFTISNPTGPTANILLALAFAGDVSGVVNAISVNKFNGQLPSFYLNYNNLTNTPTIPAQFNPIAGTGMSFTGTYPNITFNSSAAGFNTAGIYLKAISSTIIGLDTLIYRKMDTAYMTNDSTFNFSINSSPYTLTIKGGAHGGGGGSGTVTIVTGVNANGVTWSITNPTTNPALTISLGAITPSTVNALTLAAISNAFTITGGTGTARTLTVNGNATVSGTNTGDVTLAGENYLSIVNQVITAAAVNVSGTNITGVLKAAAFPAQTGDVTNSAGSLATTISNSAVTYAKMQNVTAARLLGRFTASTGVVQEIQVGSGLALNSGTGILTATGTAGSPDTLIVQKMGTGLSLSYANTTGDTLRVPSITAGANISIVGDSTTGYTIAGSAGGSGATSETFAQTAHGFSVLTPVYRDGTNWKKADTINLADGIVSDSVNSSHFTVTYSGPFRKAAHGKTVGSYYYVTMPAGSTSTTSPNVSQPVFKAVTTDTILVNIHRPFNFTGGSVIAGTGTPLQLAYFKTSSTIASQPILTYDTITNRISLNGSLNIPSTGGRTEDFYSVPNSSQAVGYSIRGTPNAAAATGFNTIFTDIINDTTNAIVLSNNSTNVNVSSSSGSSGIQMITRTNGQDVWLAYQHGTVAINYTTGLTNRFQSGKNLYAIARRFSSGYIPSFQTSSLLMGVDSVGNVVLPHYASTSLTADTSNYKPAVLDASGNLVKAFWFGLSSGGSGSGSGATSETINQTAHGFSVLMPIYRDGTNWKKADTINLADGVVSDSTDANHFVVTYSGPIRKIGHGKTIGSYYYVTMPAGSTTTVSPNISQPIFKPVTADTLVVNVHRPFNFQSPAFNTIYTGDGSLLSNRVVTMAGNTLKFNGGATTFDSGTGSDISGPPPALTMTIVNTNTGNGNIPTLNVRANQTGATTGSTDVIEAYAKISNTSGTVTLIEGIGSTIEVAAGSATSTWLRSTTGGSKLLGGTITNFAGGYFAGANLQSGSPAVTNSYALYLTDAIISSGTLTNNYGIWQNDAAATNRFNGPINSANIIPSSTTTYNLGSASVLWNQAFVQKVMANTTTDNNGWVQVGANSSTVASAFFNGASSNVSSPTNGMMWYNSTTHELDFRDNGVTSNLIPLYGSFTPSLTNTTNITTSSLSQAVYSKVGNIVTATVSGAFTPTAGSSTPTTLTIGLPINTATTTQTGVGSGTIAINAGGLGYVATFASVNAASTFQIFWLATSTTSCNFSVTVQYHTD